MREFDVIAFSNPEMDTAIFCVYLQMTCAFLYPVYCHVIIYQSCFALITGHVDCVTPGPIDRVKRRKIGPGYQATNCSTLGTSGKTSYREVT